MIEGWIRLSTFSFEGGDFMIDNKSEVPSLINSDISHNNYEILAAEVSTR